jgi:hypothetical protein
MNVGHTCKASSLLLFRSYPLPVVVYPTHGCCDSLGRQLLFFLSIKIFRIFFSAAIESYRFRTIAVVGEGCGGGAGYAAQSRSRSSCGRAG